MASPEEMLRAGLLASGFITSGIVFDVQNIDYPRHIIPNVGGVAVGSFSAADTFTVSAPPGLKSLLGKYNDDPSWDEFPTFLEQYRREIDAINE